MLLGLSASLQSLVQAKFGIANASSALLFSPTEVAVIRTASHVPFQLRYCPSLIKKPAPRHDVTATKKTVDPFENPAPDLHIADVPATRPTHALILNKFPIIAEHFLLATKSYKKQCHLLEQDDLETTYACLKAWQEGPVGDQKQLFAFFNSGEHSGASQPRRHLQFLPVENIRGDGEQSSSWSLLINAILSGPKNKPGDGRNGFFQNPDLPFVHFAWLFDREPSGAQLLSIYQQLYHSAKAAINQFIAAHPQQLALHSAESGDSSISYNLAMTVVGMMIVPRRAEGATLRQEDDSEVGFVALNGTLLAGTLMVKNAQEWDLLRKKPGTIDNTLMAIGIPVENPRSKSRV